MKEQELIDLGFKREDIDEYGSTDYYFTLDIGDIGLITNCLSDNVPWYVEIFDYQSFRLYDADSVRELIHILTIGTVIK
jgi:hypothetical protein